MKTTILALAVLASTPALASGWETVAKDDRVTVETRTQSGSSVKEIRAQGIIDAPAWVLKNVVDDIEGYTQLIPYTTQASVVAMKGDQRVSHQRIEMPFMQAREYVVTVEDKTAVKDGRTTYVCAWHSASVAYASFVSEGAVRVDINEGSWTFEEMADGRTLATFQMAVDPAGSMPAFAVNMAQKLTISRYLDNLESRARLAKYRTRSI